MVDLRVDPTGYQSFRVGDHFIDWEGTERIVTNVTLENGVVVAFVSQPVAD